MKRKLHYVLILLLASGISASGQITNKSILSGLETELITTEKKSDMLITPTGLNVFLQRKTLSYLTGVSDLSLAKFYASVSTENEKLNLGFNIPVKYDDNSLMLLINPVVEADAKNSFSTLYKNDKWQGTIRAGLKLTYLLPFGTMNFLDGKKTNLDILRKTKYEEIASAYKAEDDKQNIPVTTLTGNVTLPVTEDLSPRELRKKQRDAYDAVGIAEADYIEKNKSYTWMQTGWISAWGFTPVTEASKYISPNYLTAFEATRFHLWEINLQYTHLFQNSRLGSFYLSPWIKRFQNNSANADLMTNVDYGLYNQVPGTAQTNLALIETNPAFVGIYSEFMTTNFNFQLVYITPFTNTLIKPGISIRYEKNWGDYSPQNWRFGLPLAIQGKSTPINIELQYRLNNVNNYKNEVDHSPKKTFGISVGLPFSLLYK